MSKSHSINTTCALAHLKAIGASGLRAKLMRNVKDLLDEVVEQNAVNNALLGDRFIIVVKVVADEETPVLPVENQ